MGRTLVFLFLSGLSFVCFGDEVSFGASLNGKKVIPIGKKIEAGKAQIVGAFERALHREPTPAELEKANVALKDFRLPPKNMFNERREAVGDLAEAVLGRETTREERRELMRFFAEQEAAKKVKDEQIGGGGGPGGSGENGNSIPSTFLNDAALTVSNVGDVSAATGGGSVGTSPIGVGVAGEAEPASDETGSSPTRRSAHVAAALPPPPAPVMPIIFPGDVDSLPPPSKAAAFALPPPIDLRESLAKALEEKVRTGEISREDSTRAMKDIVAGFQGNRGNTESLMPGTSNRIDGPKSVPNLISSAQDETPEGSQKLFKKPTGGAFYGSAVSGKVGSGSSGDAVQGEMSKVLSQFGKLSLASDNGKNGKSTGGLTAVAVGVAGSSGGSVVAPSDNSGLTPSIVSKSGGLLNLAGKPLDEKGKVKSWLDGVIQKYLAKRGKTDPADRSLASPMKNSGLPNGTLTAKEPMEANFVPDRLESAEPASDGPASPEKDPKKRWALILGLAALGLSGFSYLRRLREQRGREESAVVKRNLG